MAGQPTRQQLRNGASGIAYRAWQLAGVAELLHGAGLRAPDPRAATTANNALIESALGNARGLAWFFTRRSDVHFSMYDPTWSNDDIVAVAAKVEEPVSRFFSHASKGDRESDKHPGIWPVPELALVLVGSLATLVGSLNSSSDAYDLAWFSPSPAQTYRDLIALDLLAVPTAISENRRVVALTRALRSFLASS